MLRSLTLILAVVMSLNCQAQGSEPADEEDPLSPERVVELTKSFEKTLVESARIVRENPGSVGGYSQRGDACFFLGRFDEAVADYDKMIDLDESGRTSHWRRGIALFYAKRFKDAAEQFENYHSFDQIDRENGIWRYLSQHMSDGRDKARQGLLKYRKDDREPFPAVYKLFAGVTSPDSILKQISEADIANPEREKRLFYANLYIGLNFAVEDDARSAMKYLNLATRNTWAPDAGYGPNFMWHVGRLHESQLRAQMKKPEPK